MFVLPLVITDLQYSEVPGVRDKLCYPTQQPGTQNTQRYKLFRR